MLPIAEQKERQYLLPSDYLSVLLGQHDVAEAHSLATLFGRRMTNR